MNTWNVTCKVSSVMVVLSKALAAGAISRNQNGEVLYGFQARGKDVWSIGNWRSCGAGNELSFPDVIMGGDAKVIDTTSSNSLKAEHVILQDVV